jgi:ABC-type uncharacterized transport system permease subunit
MFFSPSVLLAGGVMFFGLMALIIGFIALANDSDDIIAPLVFLLSGFLCMLLGFVWLRKSMKNDEKEALAEKEIQAMELIARLGGRITTYELTTKMNVTMTEADQILKNLQLQGKADLRITDKGDIVYEVKNLLVSEDDKKNSESV